MPVDFDTWSVLYHMSSGIDPSYDFIIPIPIWVVYDLDKTLTSEDSVTVYEEYNENVCSVLGVPSFKLRKIINEIDLSPDDFSIPQKRYSNELRRLGFKKKHHNKAVILTGDSKNIKSPPYSFDAFLEQRKMNCNTGISTGSPQDVAAAVSKKRLGIKEPNIVGSIPKYNQDGYIESFEFNLGTNKRDSLTHFHYPDCYCNCSLFVQPTKVGWAYTTDDLSSFEIPTVMKIGSIGGLTFHVGGVKSERKEEFIIFTPQLKKDSRLINRYLKLYRKSLYYTILHRNPIEVSQVIGLAEKILKTERVFEQDFISYGKRLSDLTSQFLNLELAFPRFTTRVEERRSELEGELYKEKPDLEKIKISAKEMIEILKSNDSAFHCRKERKEELEGIIKHF
jgi:hypothetical protein